MLAGDAASAAPGRHHLWWHVRTRSRSRRVPGRRARRKGRGRPVGEWPGAPRVTATRRASKAPDTRTAHMRTPTDRPGRRAPTYLPTYGTVRLSPGWTPKGATGVLGGPGPPGPPPSSRSRRAALAEVASRITTHPLQRGGAAPSAHGEATEDEEAPGAARTGRAHLQHRTRHAPERPTDDEMHHGRCRQAAVGTRKAKRALKRWHDPLRPGHAAPLWRGAARHDRGVWCHRQADDRCCSGGRGGRWCGRWQRPGTRCSAGECRQGRGPRPERERGADRTLRRRRRCRWRARAAHAGGGAAQARRLLLAQQAARHCRPPAGAVRRRAGARAGVRVVHGVRG